MNLRRTLVPLLGIILSFVPLSVSVSVSVSVPVFALVRILVPVSVLRTIPANMPSFATLVTFGPRTLLTLVSNLTTVVTARAVVVVEVSTFVLVLV